jgi:hypothetical protein
MLFLLLHFFELASAKKMGNYGVLFNVQDFIAQSTTDGKGINRCLSVVANRVWFSQNNASYTILFPRRPNGGAYSIWGQLGPWKFDNPTWSFNGVFPTQAPGLTIQINIVGLSCTHEELNAVIGTTLNQTAIDAYSYSGWGDSNIYYMSATYPVPPSNPAPPPPSYGVTATSTMNDFIEKHIAELHMHCNGNPGSEGMLSYNIPQTMPVIESHHPDAHYFFNLEGFHSGNNYCPQDYNPNNASQGQLHNIGINIMGLRLQGIDKPQNTAVYNTVNPSAQHDNDFSGGLALKCSFFYKVQIDNIAIENMYGTGILVSNTDNCPPPQTPPRGLAYRNSNVVVENNVIRNVWGLRYKQLPPLNNYDNMGDGILFAGIKGGIVRRNLVYNDLAYTHQYGRIGISAMAEHNWGTIVEENVVHGYDRGMHSEDNLGGFEIRRNRITGSETGIVFDNNITYKAIAPNSPDGCPKNDPCKVVFNYISNEGVINSTTLQKIYPPGLIWSRKRHRTNEHYQSEFHHNYLLLNKDAVREYSSANRPTNFQSTWEAPNPERLHFLSGLRGQIIYCNVMRTIGQLSNQLASQPICGGLKLYSYCPNDVIGVDASCVNYAYPAMPLPDCQANPDATIQVTIKENSIENVEMLFLSNHISSNSNQYIEMNRILPTPPNIYGILLGQYQANLPVSPDVNCAQAWNNTLCNGKPIVAEHDYLWDNHILSNSAPHSGETIIVGGVLQIDANVTFTNCTFLMASGASIQITNGHTLILETCTLQAACDDMWAGIIADSPTEKIEATNCIFRDMQGGLLSENGALVYLINNRFLDNYFGLRFRNTPPGYVTGLAGNQGVVQENTFTSTGTGPLYLTGSAQAVIGIHAHGCSEVEIGALLPGKGNEFFRINTGVYIEPTNTSTNSTVRLLHNAFHDIHQMAQQALTPEDILNNTYTTPDGAGVFIRRSPFPSYPKEWCFAPTPMIHIEGLNHSAAFERCDKAVAGTGTGLTVYKYTVQDCVGGLMMNDALYQSYDIWNTHLYNVYTGIQLIGDLQQAKLTGNIITLRDINHYLPASPVGVDIRYWGNLHAGQTEVLGNDITIPGCKGVGLQFYQTGSKALARGNILHFTTNQAGVDNPNLPLNRLLIGMQSVLGLGNQLSCNTVNGLQTQSALFGRNSQALSLHQSKEATVNCNQVNNTRFGLSAFGDCTTLKENIAANTLSNHLFGLLTFPSVLSQEGELGDIGLPGSQDNNNLFIGGYNPVGEQTYRFWTPGVTPNSRIIFTIQNPQNGSNVTGGKYDLQVAPNPENCLGLLGCHVGDPSSVSFLDEGLSLDIAEDSIPYYAFPAVSEWAAKYGLYTDLERDSVLRAANAVLSSFYQTAHYQALGAVRSAEQKLARLADSVCIGDTTILAQRLAEANAAVLAMPDSTNFLFNEKWVNGLYLHIFEMGRDTINEATRDSLEFLAKSCPAVEGLGVYRARMLYAFFEPGLTYDDFVLCNAQQKGAGGLFDDWMTFLNQGSDGKGRSGENPRAGADELLVYPNPTDAKVHFVRDAMGSLDAVQICVFDLTGRVVLQSDFNGHMDTVLDLSALLPGIYFYSYSDTKDRFSGKIEKH